MLQFSLGIMLLEVEHEIMQPQKDFCQRRDELYRAQPDMPMKLRKRIDCEPTKYFQQLFGRGLRRAADSSASELGTCVLRLHARTAACSELLPVSNKYKAAYSPRRIRYQIMHPKPHLRTPPAP